MSEHQKYSAEDVLSAFAVEPSHDKPTLDRYLLNYPEFTAELLDLALELELGAEQDVGPLDPAVVDTAWARYMNASSSLTPARFRRDAAIAMGMKSAALMSLRDRAVKPSSITAGFLAKLGTALQANVDDLAAYLAQPRILPGGASFKAGSNPETADQVTLEDLLRQCGHSPEEISRLLAGE